MILILQIASGIVLGFLIIQNLPRILPVLHKTARLGRAAGLVMARLFTLAVGRLRGGAHAHHGPHSLAFAESSAIGEAHPESAAANYSCPKCREGIAVSYLRPESEAHARKEHADFLASIPVVYPQESCQR